MRALTVSTDRTPRLAYVPDYPAPEPKPGEVRIRVRLAGVCSTDLEIERGYMRFEGVPGHEFVGVVEIGDASLIGKRVVADINCACHACEMCRRGLPNHCPHRTTLGIAGRDGAFADYLTIPAGNCYVVPESITDRHAVFVELLAAAAHVLDAAKFARGTRVAVIGAGRLGLLVSQVLKTAGCDLIAVDRAERSLALCESWGIAACTPESLQVRPDYDVVVDCTGSPEGLKLGLQLCRPCGTIVLKSTYANPAPIDLAPLVVNEVSVIGSRCGDFPRAIELLERGAVQVDPLISGVYPLSAGVEAFSAATQPENLKILIEPGEMA